MKYQHWILNLGLLLEIWCIMHKAVPSITLNLSISHCAELKEGAQRSPCDGQSKATVLCASARRGFLRWEQHFYKTADNSWTSRWNSILESCVMLTANMQREKLRCSDRKAQDSLSIRRSFSARAQAETHVSIPTASHKLILLLLQTDFPAPYCTFLLADCSVWPSKNTPICVIFHTHRPETKFSMKEEQFPPAQLNIQTKQQ